MCRIIETGANTEREENHMTLVGKRRFSTLCNEQLARHKKGRFNEAAFPTVRVDFRVTA